MKIKNIEMLCQIEPEKGFLEAEVLLSLSDYSDNIQLLLNPDFVWDYIQIKDGDNWQPIVPTERGIPEDAMFKIAKLWEFETQNGVSKEKLILKAKYHGKIQKSNWDLSYISSDFVELAIYGVWYPITLENNRHSFDIKLEAPSNWEWLSNGQLLSKGIKDEIIIWTWKSEETDLDITLLGIPKERMYNNPKGHFWGPKEFVEEHLFYEKQLLDFKKDLENWLGKPSFEGKFNYAFTPREKGGQYARTNLIVTIRELPKDEDLVPRVLQGMLHEISHFWWNRTSTNSYHNWLDEALAEYTSSLIVSEKNGGDQWLDDRATRVLKALEKSGETPAIKTITRSHKMAYTVFYYRGFLLFRELHKLMGTINFKKLIADFAEKCTKRNEITTDDFIDTLTNFSDKELDLVTVVTNWLDFEGTGIPK